MITFGFAVMSRALDPGRLRTLGAFLRPFRLGARHARNPPRPTTRLADLLEMLMENKVAEGSAVPRKMGRRRIPLEERSSERVVACVTPPMRDRWTAEADAREITLTDLLKRSVTEYLERHPRETFAQAS